MREVPVDGSYVESDNRCDLPPAPSLGDEQDDSLLGLRQLWNWHDTPLAGRAAIAAQVLSSSTALMEEIGARPPWFARISRKTLAVIHTELDDTAFAKAWEQGLTMTADEAVALALDSLAAAVASAESGL